MRLIDADALDKEIAKIVMEKIDEYESISWTDSKKGTAIGEIVGLGRARELIKAEPTILNVYTERRNENE